MSTKLRRGLSADTSLTSHREPSPSARGANASRPAPRRPRAANVFDAHWEPGGVKIEGDWKGYIRETWVQGEVFEVVFQDIVTTRSAKANRYLWGVVYALIAQHTGHSPEAIHDAMCELHLPDEHARVEFFNRMTGEKLEVEVDSRRSSKLSGMAFYDFVEEVRQWALNFLDVVTPDPDPEYWRKRTPKERPADVMRREKGAAA
jgi:hypothetical protein